MKQRLSLISLAIVAASSLAIASTSFAANYKGDYKGEAAMPAPCPQEKGLMDGFYVGANVGYDSYRMRQSVGLASATASMTQNPALNATGWVGGLFAGYGQYVNNNFYLGAEIFGDISNASTTQTVTATGTAGTGSYYTNTSVKGTYGIDVIPGVKINNNTLLYLKGGYIRTKIRINETSTIGGLNSTNNNWQGGWNYGVGAESSLYDNWSVRTEYTHANINAYTISASQTRVTPSDNQVMLGIIYHIA
jgi:outer membrane immunogenic protein